MNDRDYISGVTLVLTVGVVAPNTQTPIDASQVILDALVKGVTSVTPDTVDFTRDGTGLYSLLLDTTDMEPGLWTWRAIAYTTYGRGIKEDTFVLVAAT